MRVDVAPDLIDFDAVRVSPSQITSEMTGLFRQIIGRKLMIYAATSYSALMRGHMDDGAIIHMSAHERTIACGRIDHEFTADDLPEQARHFAGYLRRAYSDGVEIDEIWGDINAHIDVLFPITGKTADGGRFFSRSYLELQRLTRNTLEEILHDCCHDCHMTAMRYSRSYRRFYKMIREAEDTKIVGQAMKEAYAAKESGELSLKSQKGKPLVRPVRPEQL